MSPRVVAAGEWSLLATLAQHGVWLDAVTEELFSDPVARRVWGWMQDAREQTGHWSALAVGCFLEAEGFDVPVVDAVVDALADTAPVYSPANVPGVLGFLIEQHGRRTGATAADVVLAKHRAGCPLTERDVAAVQEAAA